MLAELMRSMAPAQSAGLQKGVAAGRVEARDEVTTSSNLVAARGIADALPPRLRQTLDLLLAGDAEKRIALKLGLKQSSIHSYVKVLYKRFDVSSRAELLAKFVAR